MQGVRQGRAVYTFADGSVEESSYSGGEQTGPAKFTWANGAVREGNKVHSFGDSFHNNSESEREGPFNDLLPYRAY